MWESSERLELSAGMIWDEGTLEIADDLAVRALVSRRVALRSADLIVSRMNRAVSVPLALREALPAWYGFWFLYGKTDVDITPRVFFSGNLPLNLKSLVINFINENTRD